jgi:hypothetical protein
MTTARANIPGMNAACTRTAAGSYQKTSLALFADRCCAGCSGNPNGRHTRVRTRGPVATLDAALRCDQGPESGSIRAISACRICPSPTDDSRCSAGGRVLDDTAQSRPARHLRVSRPPIPRRPISEIDVPKRTRQPLSGCRGTRQSLNLLWACYSFCNACQHVIRHPDPVGSRGLFKFLLS